MQPVCSPAGEQDGGGPVRLPAALSGSWPAPARGIAGAQPCLGAVCGTAMPHNSGGGGGGGNPAPAASSWVFHKPDPSVFKSPRRCPGHSELLGFMPFYFAGLVDKVWSGTPIRDNGCCYHPLTGVPCLRPGPRKGHARQGWPADVAEPLRPRRVCESEPLRRSCPQLKGASSPCCDLGCGASPAPRRLGRGGCALPSGARHATTTAGRTVTAGTGLHGELPLNLSAVSQLDGLLSTFTAGRR